MMTTAAKTQIWRFGAIAVFFGLPLLTIGAIAFNLVDTMNEADLAARARTMTASITAQLRKPRARALTPMDADALYLTSISESLARAEIQEYATKLVTQMGGRLAEVQVAGTPEEEAKGIVAIEIVLDIDNEGLLNLLYAAESGLPLIDVTELNAQITDRRIEGRGNGARALRVDMTLRAHWRKGMG